MEYDYLVSPFDFDSFDNINKTQAQKYFEWYIAQSESRIDLLARFINENKSEHINLDNSPESLIHLWKWIEDEILSGEQHFANERELTFDQLKIITDISFYFAVVILYNNPSIKWGYFTKPKSKMSVNKPVILGFNAGMDLDPRLIVRNCAYRSIKNKTCKHLYNIICQLARFYIISAQTRGVTRG